MFIREVPNQLLPFVYKINGSLAAECLAPTLSHYGIQERIIRFLVTTTCTTNCKNRRVNSHLMFLLL